MKLIPNFPKYSISIDGKTVIGPRGEMKIQMNNCGYRLENLQWATMLEQCVNKSKYCSNTSGVKNIYLNRGRAKRFIYSRQRNGIEYTKACYTLPQACFEQYCHSRMTSQSDIS